LGFSAAYMIYSARQHKYIIILSNSGSGGAGFGGFSSLHDIQCKTA